MEQKSYEAQVLADAVRDMHRGKSKTIRSQAERDARQLAAVLIGGSDADRRRVKSTETATTSGRAM